MNKVVYLIGSLRNKRIPELAKKIREENPDVEVFDDWFAAGPEADDYWKQYEQDRGRTYQEALQGYAAKHVFDFDRFHLDRATHIILVLPAGKSGHMEAMYGQYGAAGNPRVAILLDPEDVRWDVMYQFIPTILNNDEEINDWLNDDSIPTRRTGTPQFVPTGHRVFGLLPERSRGSGAVVLPRDKATPSRSTDALGSKQVAGTSGQDHEASCRCGKVRRQGPEALYDGGVAGVGKPAGRVRTRVKSSTVTSVS